MHRYIIIVLLTCSIQTHAQNRPIEKYKPISFGSIKPSGWLKTQMQNDLDGFVGNLDKLVPELINDPIYSSGRLHKNSAAKELGNLKDGDAEGSEQYKWWNSENVQQARKNFCNRYCKHSIHPVEDFQKIFN
jgi:hypothetical protein